MVLKPHWALRRVRRDSSFPEAGQNQTCVVPGSVHLLRPESVGRAVFCWLCRPEVISFGILNKDLKLMEFASRPGLKAPVKQYVLFYLNTEQ